MRIIVCLKPTWVNIYSVWPCLKKENRNKQTKPYKNGLNTVSCVTKNQGLAQKSVSASFPHIVSDCMQGRYSTQLSLSLLRT